MKVRILAGVAATALLLAGCTGSGDDATPEPTAPQSAAPQPTETTGGNQAQGDVDCSKFEADGVTTFIIWTQIFMQLRDVDGLQTLSILGYSADTMNGLLDSFDQLRGIEGEVPGTPDEALDKIRAANDIVGAAVAKGDAATADDLAGVADAFPDTDGWIAGQASITDALHVACPNLQGQ